MVRNRARGDAQFAIIAKYKLTMRLAKSLLLGGVLPHVGAAARHADDTLHPGTPESVGLLPEPLQEMQKNISAYEKPANYGDFTDGQVRPIQPSSAVIGEYAFEFDRDGIHAN